MQRKYFHLTLFWVFLWPVIGLTQSTNFIYARLIDAETKDGIPFATIQIQNYSQGVISNADGDFSIPAVLQGQYDTLIISCIGYKSKKVAFQELSLEGLNTISLSIATTLLEEIEITARKTKPLSPYKIVRKAIAQIPDNYPHQAFSYVAYYRDYQKQAGSYLNLNEALLEVHDQGFQTYDRSDSQVRLLEYKANTAFEQDLRLKIAYDNTNRKYIPNAHIDPSGGNELTLLMTHDAIRNYAFPSYSFIYTLQEDLVSNHSFKLKESIDIEQGSVYVIDFESLNTVDKTNYQAYGQLFINRETFAIHKLSYSLYKVKHQKEEFIFSTQVEYAEKSGQMYLKYISLKNAFKSPNPKDFTIQKMLYFPNKKELSITFNQAYNPEDIEDLSRYRIQFDQNRIKVRKVHTDPSDPKRILLSLQVKQSDQIQVTDNNADLINIEIKGLSDLEGRILGERTYLTHQQYRELFVQETQLVQATDAKTFIDKFKPLKGNIIADAEQIPGYWMNTPLKQ